MSYRGAKKRILESGKDPQSMSQKTIQLVCNYNPYEPPQVETIDFKLGQISDPYEATQAKPVNSTGGWPLSQRLQTWGARGTHLRNVSELITSTRGEAKHYNTLNAIGVRPGKPLDKGKLASYRQKDSGEIAGDLPPIWELVKSDSPIYQYRERALTMSFPEVGGATW